MPQGDICPIYFMGTSNGLYYFYALDCDNGGQWVGAQDTRNHQLGVDCSTCNDPLLLARSFHRYGVPAPKLVPRCECGEEARTNGLPSLITFDHPFHPTNFLVWERGFRSLASYTDGGGRQRNVRLLHLDIGAYPLALVTFQVGQECDVSGGVPGGVKVVAAEVVYEEGYYHIIKVTGTGGQPDRYYDVLVSP